MMIAARTVGGHPPGARLLCLAAACAVPVVYAVWVRPRMPTRGATGGEAAGTYPGDEIIPEPGNDGHDVAVTTWQGMALAGADGR